MKIYQVDAFTDKPFKGNPAAVCILDSEPQVKWMQDVANEMNLAETAFLVPKNNGYSLRWFTPESEIDLCGHATLASAHILWEKGYLEKEKEAVFNTKSGVLTAKYNEGWIELNFPATPEEKADVPSELIEALAVNPVYTGKNIFDYIIEVESEDEVKNIKPDFTKLMKVQMRGVIVTAQSSEYDFISRFFAPEVGIFEDPVTGSSHCCLGPYWKKKLGKDRFIAYQASKRGGILKVQVADERVLISGKAVTVMEGVLLETNLLRHKTQN
ncbi:MAG: PhzF family phenazine biosynthesis protein [Bacillota bacterium]|jgi:PhzF family phenazine biosynthesis protein|nr:PhzF family phenazine biosynthesis protein [Bacillota bacterium]NLV63107.1 PhzF family phenazine biosynthesis protein [Clostridiaceae bacterium]